MIFQIPQKEVDHLYIKIENRYFESVEEFDFLGLIINESLLESSHQ